MNLKQVEYGKSLWNQLETFASSTASNKDIIKTVTSILRDIEIRGDEALLEKTKLFDKASLLPSQLQVTEEELSMAMHALNSEELSALEDAQDNILKFHNSSLPKDWEGKNSHGAICGEKHYPLRRIGLYVPGGSVPLVSTVLMTATLANVAKIPEITVVTPPNVDGNISPKLLGTLKFSGISEIYKAGGAQAIGALAFGTQTIPAVDKIFGPGNAYVNEAKRQVFGKVGVDLLPGPSEVMIIADETADPTFVAAALLAQAEHGSGKEKAYLIYSDHRVFTATCDQVEKQIERLANKDGIRFVLENGFFAVQVTDLSHATEVANFVAPEHLELQVSDDKLEFLVNNITTAGALLLGHYSATALGDFIAGPSHVLPTGRSSRFSSGLRIGDFFRRSSFIKYDRDALIKAKSHINSFAKMELLDGHGASVNLRASSRD